MFPAELTLQRSVCVLIGVYLPAVCRLEYTSMNLIVNVPEKGRCPRTDLFWDSGNCEPGLCSPGHW